MAKYDLLLRGTTLADPRNKVNGRYDLGIAGGRVVEVGRDLPGAAAARIVDMSGYTAVPGVIDTHTHILGPAQRMMALAGVCTALDMSDFRGMFAEFPERGCGMNVAGLQAIGPWAGDTPTEAEVGREVQRAVADGAIGIKMIGGHRPSTPAATELMIEMANRAKVYVAFHVGSTETGSHLKGLLEAVRLAAGNCLHIAHVNSYLRGMVRDPVEEVLEGLAAIEGKTNLVSESYLAVINGTSGRIGSDNLPSSHVTRNCLKMRGYTPDRDGLEAAIRDGYGLIQSEQGGINVLVTGPEGAELWKSRGTQVSMSFPVNQPQSTFLCAVRKDAKKRFIVDAISTDGGGIPRNVTVEYGLLLVRYQAMTFEEWIWKASAMGAIMLGLKDKGHLGVGADADVTVLDRDLGKAVMTIVAGKIIMAHGVIYGSGGTVITTPHGEAAVKASGVDYRIVHPEEMLLYTKGRHWPVPESR
jgi:hypothetical protein